MQPVRIAETSKQAEEWALVLAAIGIPHSIEEDDDERILVLVAGDDVRRAELALGAYDRETRTATPIATLPEPEPPPYPWMSGATVGLLMLGAFAITGPSASRSDWFVHGAAVAGRILSDEPWRVVTALTLHADLVHVLGNAAATAVLLGPLAQRLGVGAALVLTLLAGAVGNVLSAMVHESTHASIGASTATFGVIGALGALRMIPSATTVVTMRRLVLVIGATLALLVMLGTARDADVVAHALGLGAGAALGAVAGIVLRRPPPLVVQAALTMLSALAVAGAWRLALR